MQSDKAGSLTASPEDRSSLNRRIFRKLMPLLILVYTISFLDRTNIALAKHSMSIDLGLSAATYGLGAGLFFLSYASLEIPSNLLMHRVGARFWITRIMVTWGVLSTAMAFVQGETSFYVLRLLLGAAEAGFFPGVILYLTYWFDRKDCARATGYFLLGVCIANVIGGPIGGALLELDGAFGMHGWQWLFFLEGLPAIVLAYVVWKKLPDRPSAAPWLSKQEATDLEHRLSEREHNAAHNFKDCLRDKQVWLAIFVYFCHQITIYAVIFFLPGIIGASGHFSPFLIGVLSAAPWLAASIGAATLPGLAKTSAQSRALLVVGFLIMASGLVVAVYAPPALALLAMCVAALMFFGVQSVLFSFPSSRLSGTALAGGLGLLNSCGVLGGFVGPTVMGIVEQTTGKAINGLLLMAGVIVLAAVCAVRLRHGSERHPRDAVQEQHPAVPVAADPQ
ncbi:major facilitator transporter [Caballeronia terrestris]|jgi:sugar phosphate permease|uniref:Major facilitator transporter n=1 Tax=Caballeronia terrestris TaxID=1226301 RepID=A0A158KVM1_9BURK|nr:MFS transporter [Caballeronia terrestris]SAL85154.1 major facilitator transporter [Caballeronia terrestris]